MTNQWVSVSYSCTMTLPDECRFMPSVHHVVPDVCYVMLCLSRDVEKAGKRWRWPALGSGWSELASNYQCSRSKFLPELSIALCRRWSCKKETGDVHSAVSCCVQIENLSAWSFCARNSCVRNMQCCTQCTKYDAQIALCVCTKKVCKVYRAVCVHAKRKRSISSESPLSLPSAVLALAADFQSETTARQYDWLGVPWSHIFRSKMMTYLCATPNQTMRKKFKCAGAIKWQISGGYAERQSGYCMMQSVEGVRYSGARKSACLLRAFTGGSSLLWHGLSGSTSRVLVDVDAVFWCLHLLMHNCPHRCLHQHHKI